MVNEVRVINKEQRQGERRKIEDRRQTPRFGAQGLDRRHRLGRRESDQILLSELEPDLYWH